MKVLLVEDDTNIVDFMCTAFQIGWPEARLEVASDGAAGLKAIETGTPDIILLDLGLPDMNGFEVLKQIRLFSRIPIIIVTVSGDESYVVRGLALGADDYMVKPLRPLELIARMKASMKKHTSQEELTITCGDLCLNPSSNELLKSEKKILLTETESRLLYVLMKNAGKVVTYRHLATEVWGDSDLGFRGSLKVHIRHIRQKIEDDPSHPRLIVNNRLSSGYSLAKPR